MTAVLDRDLRFHAVQSACKKGSHFVPVPIGHPGGAWVSMKDVRAEAQCDRRAADNIRQLLREAPQ